MTDVRLSTVLRPSDVELGFRAGELREGVERLLLARLISRGMARTAANDAIASIMAREAQGSTSTGAIAVPHARIAGIDDFVGALGINADGILDDARSPRLMLAFVSPVDAAAAHLRFLSSVAKAFRRESVISDLLEAGSNDSVLAILRDNGV